MMEDTNAKNADPRMPPVPPKHFPWGKLIASLIVLSIGGLGALYYAFTPGGGNNIDDADTVMVSDFNPTGDIPAGNTNINVDFNRDIVSANEVDRVSPVDLLAVSPPLSGQYRWISQSAFRFIPDAPLPDGTEFTVTIRDDILKKHHLVFGGQRIFSFKTQAFAIGNTGINFRYTDSKHKKLKALIDFDFNYPVDPQALARSLLIDIDKAGTVAFNVTQKSAGTHLTVETHQIATTKSARDVRLSFSRPLPSTVGNMSIRSFEQTLILEGKKSLKVESVQPEQRGDAFVIQIRFSSYVDPKRAKNYISVSPKGEYRFEQSWRYINVYGDFSAASSYTVDIKKGLTGEDGALLEHDFSRTVIIPDLEPSVSFASPGLYLPKKGSGNIAINSVNVKKINVAVTRVFVNNIVFFLGSGDNYGYYGGYEYGGTSPGNLGKQVFSKAVTVEAKRNKKVVTDLDMTGFVSDKYQGVFAVSVRDTDSYWRRETKMIIATDMGIIAKVAENKLMVFVNSLKTLKPYGNTTINLISKTNQVMASVKTDASGVATISNLATLSKEFTPYVITVSRGDDFSFLKFANTTVSAADFDTGGRTIPPAWQYRTYLYTDRGVYRPEDTAHLTGIIRDRDLTEPRSVPVKLTVRSMDNRIFKTFATKIGDGGLVSFDIDFPRWAQTGYYSAVLATSTGDELASLNLQVEDFMPDQIKVAAVTDKPAYNPGDTVNIDVTGTMLFGPPAANKYVEASVNIKPVVFKPKEYGGFSFYNSTKNFSGISRDLGDATLDTAGRHRFTYAVDTDFAPPSSLKGTVFVTVRDEGGRAVSGATTFDIHPYPDYVGLRKKVEGYATPDKPTVFEVIALKPDGKPFAGRNIDVALYRIVWQTTLKRDSRGYYRYVSEREESLVTTQTVTTSAAPTRVVFTPKEYGSYQIIATDNDGGASSSVSFYASGWGYSPWAMSKPDRLDIDFDKKEYDPGDTATVQIRAPFSGKLILTVERDSIEETHIVTMQENTASITLPVKADWAPNVYVVGTLIRSTEGLEEHAPARAYGAFPLHVSFKKYALDLAIEAPGEMRPDNDLKVSVSVPRGGPSAFVTLAAVDEGILQLTGFASPDPLKYFFSKQRLSVETHDLYTFLLPEVKSASKQSSSGGGADGERRKNLNPIAVKRVKPVALWSGVVRPDASGKAVINLHVPQFNGSLRLMAVGVRGDHFGAARHNVTVADTIVLSPTIPRFLAPKDSFRLPVSVYNNTGKDGSFTVSVSAEGPVTFTDGTLTLDIPSKSEKLAFFEGAAQNAVGAAVITVRAKGNGQKTADITELGVRPVNPLTIESGSGSVSPGNSATVQLPGDFLPGTVLPRVMVSGLPASSLGGSLQYLLKYPYGCLEQTTSKAFPLLYFSDLAKAIEPALFAERSVGYYVNEAIGKLESMQFGNGGFSVWPGVATSNNYASIYASHFLVEAKKAGYLVQDGTINGIRRNMDVIVSRPLNADSDYQRRSMLERRVYALYVLALMGDPDLGSMMYLNETQLDNMDTYSRMRLAAAFAYANKPDMAKKLLPAKIAPSTDTKRETGNNFNSPVRANAIILSTLADIDPHNPAVAVLAEKLAKSAKVGRYYTTQENAMALLALGKILHATGSGECRGSVTSGLSTLAEFDVTGVTLTDKELAGKKLTITSAGTGLCYYFWQLEGVKATGTAREYDVDIQVRRRYVNKDGMALDYRHVPHGELVIAEIEIQSKSDDISNIVIVDMLPAGLEIENPRLESRQGSDWLEKRYEKQQRLYPDYMDIRDDRLILFGDVYRNHPRVFYYALRAVSPGTFAVPSIKAEAMYNPVITSLASASSMTIEPRK